MQHIELPTALHEVFVYKKSNVAINKLDNDASINANTTIKKSKVKNI